jgi:hypothetical protein
MGLISAARFSFPRSTPWLEPLKLAGAGKACKRGAIRAKRQKVKSENDVQAVFDMKIFGKTDVLDTFHVKQGTFRGRAVS